MLGKRRWLARVVQEGRGLRARAPRDAEGPLNGPGMTLEWLEPELTGTKKENRENARETGRERKAQGQRGGAMFPGDQGISRGGRKWLGASPT
ncbi:hypothetical protein CDL15_Pgr009173 [Punica granatum]|uniref:Uncharacterized protein n=1 Tax=Punica granatum TaxID=22663 RepID=A0A218WVU9_PUNGR|nr:hypothetical protein CDL15_Pgr009173 [Punica granatum]PKI47635.1 hypothetical protein CRG98_031986 [Punica granatum]